MWLALVSFDLPKVGMVIFRDKPAISFKNGGSDVSPFSLSGTFGFAMGNKYYYQIKPDTASDGWYGSGFFRDSVDQLGNYNGPIGPYCPSMNVELAQMVSLQKTQTTLAPPPDTLDTVIVYFDGTYYVDWTMDPYRVLMSGANVGDVWMGWDTCVLRLNEKTPIGDVDGDATADTLIIYNVQSTLLSKSNTNISVIVNGSPQNLSGTLYEVGLEFFGNVILTNPNYSGADLDSFRLHRFWKFRIFDGVYMLRMAVDSARDTIFYKFGGTPVTYPTPLDTPFVKELDSIRTLGVSAQEYTSEPQLRKAAAVYDVSGKRVPAIGRRGVYFIVDEKGRVHRIVRF